MFTGIFAAELRVKNAVTPLSRTQVQTNGYGYDEFSNKRELGLAQMQ